MSCWMFWESWSPLHRSEMYARAYQPLHLGYYCKLPAELVIDGDGQLLIRFRPVPLRILTSTLTIVVLPGVVR